jgi:long-chain acyl-CoA synthetase
MASMATLQDLLDGWTRRGTRPAIMVLREPDPEVWSYAHLARTARRLATGLLRAGFEHGEAVILLGPSSPAWLAVFFASTAAGGIAVPLDAQLPDAELARLLRDSRAHRLFTTRRHLEQLRDNEAIEGLQAFLLDGNDKAPAPSWTALLAEDSCPLPNLDAEAPAVLLYTSGTTGAPKGVPLSHANLLANLGALQAEALVDEEDRVLLPLPLHHAYPLTVGVLGTLGSGSCLLLPAEASGPALARALGSATVLLGVPRLHNALLEAIFARLARWQRRLLDLCIWSRRRLGLPLGRWLLAPLRRAVAPRLRLVASGGARLEEATEWTLLALGWQVLTGYGLTETAPMLTFNLPGRTRVGSAGRPLPGVTLRIARPDESGVGEIEAQGPNVFRGYWQRPELTAKAFTADGWFRTEDRGRLDVDGYLHIASRVSELIVLPNGEKVLPEEVEAVYEQSPIVREIAVLEREGTLAALIVPDDEALRAGGAAKIDEQLRDDLDRLGRQLRPFQRVSRIAVTRAKLPRTLIGKLQRFRLPELWQAAVEGRAEQPPAELSDADRALLNDPLAKSVWQWLRQRFAGREVSLDASPQLDLAIDSLAWVELTLEIERRFGRSLGEEAVGRVVTLRDLLREVIEAPEATLLGERRLPPARVAGAGWALVRWMLYIVNRALMAVFFRLRVEGRSNLPGTGPLLLAPNHASYLDPAALAAALPLSRLPEVHWAGWNELMFATPLMRLLSRACQVFPLDPKRGGLAGLAAAESLLEQQQTVVWFPEGRRSPDGRLQPFTPGIGLLMARTGIAAVPVHIKGSFEAWPLSRRLPRPRRVSVIFGRPIGRDQLALDGAGDEVDRHIAEQLRRAVAALADGERHE